METVSHYRVWSDQCEGNRVRGWCACQRVEENSYDDVDRTQFVSESRLQWLGHVIRMDGNRLVTIEYGVFSVKIIEREDSVHVKELRKTVGVMLIEDSLCQRA